MHKISISAAAAPQTPLEELTAPQITYLYLRKPTCKEREGGETGVEGKGGKGRGRGRE